MGAVVKGRRCRPGRGGTGKKQSRNGSARKEFSAAACADENFFPNMGAVVKGRNWNRRTNSSG